MWLACPLERILTQKISFRGTLKFLFYIFYKCILNYKKNLECQQYISCVPQFSFTIYFFLIKDKRKSYNIFSCT